MNVLEGPRESRRYRRASLIVLALLAANVLLAWKPWHASTPPLRKSGACALSVRAAVRHGIPLCPFGAPPKVKGH